VNDYREIYGDEARSQTKRRAPNSSPVNREVHGPKLKGEAGLHKVMEFEEDGGADEGRGKWWR